MLPLFSPVRRISANPFLRQRNLHHGPVYALPCPGYALHFIILGQPRTPEPKNNPSLSHIRKYLCTELGLPNPSFASAFHWQPVRSTYTIPSNALLASMGSRPPPGLRLYSLSTIPSGFPGINGSTRFQNSSDTSHDCTLAMPNSQERLYYEHSRPHRL